ncbi:hypothetical protein Bca4012_026321 [Brassica carinata]
MLYSQPWAYGCFFCVVADPLEYCDVVTTTTHESLRGGMIFFRKDPVNGVEPDSATSNAVLAGLAVCLKHAQSSEFKPQGLPEKSSLSFDQLRFSAPDRLISGGSDNNLVLVDLRTFVVRLGDRVVCGNVKQGTKMPLVPGGTRIGMPAMAIR